ncbi:MAG: hypothetical protein M0Q95_08020 [Porticoccaceae bacterium]|nr:hypothetical protein [Porticoccaceae bacterium]
MTTDTQTSDLPPCPISHDNRHDFTNRPEGREALAYMFSEPDLGIAGFMYTWVEKGVASAALMACGPGVGEPIEERFQGISVPNDMDFYDWRVGSLHYKIIEPNQSAEFSIKGKRIEMDIRFEALHPPYPASAHKDGCPPYYGDDRTEQHGRSIGTWTIDGKTHQINGFCQRDHSWGPRVWGVNQHYKWFHATNSDAAIFFFEMHSFGKVNLRGYVFKDNHMAEITSVHYDYTFDDRMYHTSIDVRATDSSGRSTDIKCKAFTHYMFNADPLIELREAPTLVEIDGKPGVGWCEFCWNKQYIQFAADYTHYSNTPACTIQQP